MIRKVQARCQGAEHAVTTIRVKVRPRARVSVLQAPDDDGLWCAQLRSPPVDGRANRELIALVARHFRCPQAAVTIKAGASGRIKLVTIATR
ncbi:MAG: DUF167 domain-containing protein [Gammaproteobacteria bacterium]|nr:DUF167 domain-containing protein [Gammaproteobacteria bacterium]